MVPNPAKRRQRTPAPAPKPPELPRIAKLVALARKWQAQLDQREIKTQAEIAARSGLHPYRVSNIICLLRLDSAILEHIEGLPVGTPSGYLNERWLRPLTRLSRHEQLAAVFGRADRSAR